MRAFTVFGLVSTLMCGALCADSPMTVQKIYVEKNSKNDLASSASGYIFRSDGENPPIFIKLGDGNINQYEDVLKNAGMSFKSDEASYSSSHIPSTSKYPNPRPKPTYSSQEDDAFSEAFKNIPPRKDFESNHDFHVSKSSSSPLENLENVKSVPKIAEEDDGYHQAGIESPNSLSQYETSEELNEPNAPYSLNVKSTPGKGYVAPIYNVPDPKEVLFNRRQAPVKYPMKLKSKAAFGQRIGAYESPADVGVSGEYLGDHTEYSSHFSEDYHHKPKKYYFEKGSGDSYKSDHQSSHSEKGDKGYKKYHDFDEGVMGHHGKEGKKGFYDNESGYKKSHHNEGDKYGEVYGKLHGQKGAKYDAMEAHKKGHKTSGYHNIFHKDEFKKEHKFYDDAHKHGHHDKHGGYRTDHDKKHGHTATGVFYDADFDRGHKGGSGQHKKGYFDQDHKGYKGQSARESQYSHQDDYGKKSGHSEDIFGFNHSH